MGKIITFGGNRLYGSVRIGGAKNSVLPILAACMLSENDITLKNCPNIADVTNMLEILDSLGCHTEHEGDTIKVNAAKATGYTMQGNLSRRLRSSIFMLGPVLGRFGRASFLHPGGCEIGLRPIDMHLKGLEQLNVKIKEQSGRIECYTNGLIGAEVHLDYPSVGATENIMMAAVKATGKSTIHNAAREPEIEDLQNFLNANGFRVEGAGSGVIKIEGGRVDKQDNVEFSIMPDRIAAGTYMCAAAMTGGDVTLLNVNVSHIIPIISKLRETGCEISIIENDTVRIISAKRPDEIILTETAPHPGFPTDLQAPLFALCCIAEGTSVIVENVFENRFKHAAELSKMGAYSMIKGRTAIIRGVPTLFGTDVCATDLRGGAALVLAGLAAKGKTTISGTDHIDRGYELFVDNLRYLGADIMRL